MSNIYPSFYLTESNELLLSPCSLSADPDQAEPGAVTSDDTLNGLLIGSVVGILGGP